MSCEAYIQRANNVLPELVSAKDLVGIGLYRTAQAAYSARMAGKSPPYFTIPFRGIVYPKAGVLEFLRKASNQKKVLR